MSPWFALLESVAVALPKALLQLRLREEKRHGWVDVCMGYLIFFQPSKNKINKIDSLRRRNAIFDTWVTRLPIEMNVHVANIVWQVPQIPAFRLLASKISTSNLSPSQGRRVNWLPCFPCTKPTHQISVKNHQITHHLCLFLLLKSTFQSPGSRTSLTSQDCLPQMQLVLTEVLRRIAAELGQHAAPVRSAWAKHGEAGDRNKGMVGGWWLNMFIHVWSVF